MDSLFELAPKDLAFQIQVEIHLSHLMREFSRLIEALDAMLYDQKSDELLKIAKNVGFADLWYLIETKVYPVIMLAMTLANWAIVQASVAKFVCMAAFAMAFSKRDQIPDWLRTVSQKLYCRDPYISASSNIYLAAYNAGKSIYTKTQEKACV